MTSIDGAVVDQGVSRDADAAEVVFGEGKSTELIARIAQTQIDAKQGCLVTRIDPTAAAQVRRQFDSTHHNPLARTLRIGDCEESLEIPTLDADQPHVAVVTAGSTDIPVAEEAAETLAWMKVPCCRFEDIGVAGRNDCWPPFQNYEKHPRSWSSPEWEELCPPPSLGMFRRWGSPFPPVSVYGANFSGLTPLMGMLTSCAANVAVVNIDAGFKGGYLAGLVASELRRLKTQK